MLDGSAMSTDDASPASGHVPEPAISPVPEHLHTVTVRLVVSDGAAAIAFYCEAFGAAELGERFAAPDGAVIHAELQIGDSVVMITEDSADAAPPAGSPSDPGATVNAIMATYWEDVDAAWERAISAGATVVFPLEDQFYGERGGRLRDPFGQQWMLSQRTEILTHEEIGRRAARLFGSP
jgi:PhnB protein